MSCCPTCGQSVATKEMLVDLDDNRVTYRGQVAKLVASEAELLAILFRAAPSMVSIERIGLGLWGELHSERSRSNITVHIHRLRRKLKPLGIHIENHRGEGYSLRCDLAALASGKRQFARRRAA